VGDEINTAALEIDSPGRDRRGRGERSSPVGMAAVRDAVETGFTCWRRKERGQHRHRQ
jgi:hypothetical protein